MAANAVTAAPRVVVGVAVWRIRALVRASKALGQMEGEKAKSWQHLAQIINGAIDFVAQVARVHIKMV